MSAWVTCPHERAADGPVIRLNPAQRSPSDAGSRVHLFDTIVQSLEQERIE